MNTNSSGQCLQGATVQSLRTKIPAHLQSIFDAICYSIGLRRNPVGLITCVNQLIQDLTVAGEYKSGLDEWLKILQELRISLLEIGLEINADQVMARSLRSERLSAFENAFHPTSTHEGKNKLRAIRGLIVHSIISNRRALGNKLGKSIRKVFRDEVGGFAKVRNSLELQEEALKNLRTDFPPSSSEARFLTETIKGLTAPVHAPRKSEKITHSVIIANSGPEPEKNTQESPVAKPKAKSDLDLLLILAREQRFSTPTLNAGIEFHWDVLHPIELEHTFKKISIDLLKEDFELPLAAFLVLLLRLSPYYFDRIPVAQHKSKLALDVANGFITWPLSIVTRLPAIENESLIQTSLPEEVASRLQEILRKKPSSKMLADLFSISMDDLKTELRKYLGRIAPSSHKPTIQRLTNSWGIHLMKISGDETLAAMLSRDFKIGTTPSFNYFSCSATRIDGVLTESFIRLGLSGSHGGAHSVKSRRHVSDDQVKDLLTETLWGALFAYRNIGRNCSIKNLQKIFNRISTATYLLLMFSIGGRAAKECGISLHTLDLENSLCLVSDKIISEYHRGRVVPLITIVVKWLKFYKEMLWSLAYRVREHDKDLSNQICWLLGHPDTPATIPLLFRVKANGKIRPLGSNDLGQFLNKHGMAGNAGRHYTDQILREAMIPSCAILGMLGRGTNGQEGFGSRSALSPTTAMNACREAIAKKYSSFNLPDPPELCARKLSTTRPGAAPFKMQNWERVRIYKETGAFENCPFHEFTLAEAREFELAHQKWISTAVASDVADLALSLVLRDGVCHEEIMHGAMKELLEKKVKEDVDGLFVDVNCRSLGIRRVRIDMVTFSISCKAAEILPSEDKLDLEVSKRLSSLIERSIPKGGVEHLIQLARSYCSLRLPGALSEWGAGNILSRTTRVEFLARKTHGLCEHPNASIKNTRTTNRFGSFDLFRDLLNTACTREENRGSAELRLRELAEELAAIETEEMLPAVEMMHAFLSYLCKVADSPTTVMRYFSPMQSFISSICLRVENIREIRQEKWRQHAGDFIKSGAGDQGRNQADVAALNHLLASNQIDARTFGKNDPAKTARMICDMPTHRELVLASKIVVDETQTYLGNINLSGIWLGLVSTITSRCEEINGVRAHDIIPTTPVGVVISSESLGLIKTSNARRVNFITDPDLGKSLMVLRRQYLELDPKGNLFIFGDQENLIRLEKVGEHRDMARHALFCATGSSNVVVHSLRQKQITDAIHHYLDPLVQQQIDLNSLRCCFYTLSEKSGHGDCHTTFENYGADFDLPWRKWMDHLKATGNFNPSSTFHSSISNLSAAAFRQRKHRSKASTFPFDGTRELNGGTNRLNDLVRAGCTSLKWEKSSQKIEGQLDLARYVACRLGGKSVDMAQHISRVTTSISEQIEFCLGAILDKLSTRCDASVGFVSLSLLYGNEFEKIVMATLALFLDQALLEIMVASIIDPSEPLQLPSAHVLGALSPLIGSLKVYGFDLVAATRTRSKIHDENKNLRDLARKHGFRVEPLQSRNFIKDATIRLRITRISPKGSWLENRQAGLAFNASILLIKFFKENTCE